MSDDDDNQFTLLPGGGEGDPSRDHPSRAPRSTATVNAATTAGVFVSMADGLEEGRITPRAAALVLREYAKILWESSGRAGEPTSADLVRKAPEALVATSGKGWTAWIPGPEGMIRCPHVHRTREAAGRCWR